MSDQNNAVEETTEATEASPVSPEATEIDSAQAEQTETEPTSKAGRDAAKYRTRLREVEAERDGLQAALSVARTKVLSAKLSEAEQSVMKLVNISPDQFFTEAGEIDAEALANAREKWGNDYPALLQNNGRVPNTWDRPNSGLYGQDFRHAFSPNQ